MANVSLGEIAKTTSGGTPDRKKPEYYEGTIPWVKSGELEDKFLFKTEEHITESGLKFSNAKIFPKGTVLVALYGATVGRTAILGIDAATNQAICAIFPEDGLDPVFLMYTLMSRRDTLLSERYGGAQPNISQTVMRAHKIPLPPSPNSAPSPTSSAPSSAPSPPKTP